MKLVVCGNGILAEQDVSICNALYEEGIVGEVIVSDPFNHSLRNIASECGLTYSPSVPIDDIDIALISSVPAFPDELIQQLIGNHVPTLFELQLPMIPTQLRLVSSLSESEQRYLRLRHSARFLKSIRKLRELIQTNELGEIQYVQTNFFSSRVLPDIEHSCLSVLFPELDILHFLLTQQHNQATIELHSVQQMPDGAITMVCSIDSIQCIFNMQRQPPDSEEYLHSIVVGNEGTGILKRNMEHCIEIHENDGNKDASKSFEFGHASESSSILDKNALKAELIDFIHTSKVQHQSSQANKRFLSLFSLFESIPFEELEEQSTFTIQMNEHAFELP